MTIEELEQTSPMSYEDALRDFFESCLRVGEYDMSENAKYFIKENDLDKDEYNRVLIDLCNLEDGE